jgi:hypothetical protein
VAFVVALVALGICRSGDDVRRERPIPVKLGKLPDLRLAPREAMTEAKAKKIKDLITGLAKLDKPDFGLSPTLSGDAFSPLPGQSRATTLRITDHELKSSEGVSALVALGPEAMPFLIDALDDQTPTKLVMKRGAFGGMQHAVELPMSPVNPREAVAYKARAGKPRDDDPEQVSEYTVKIGDVCFVSIGQIVGRSYQAVRYQPTAQIILNCPAHDAKLCAEVREIWKTKDPIRTVFDSLLTDYATEGVVTDEYPDGWRAMQYVRCGAAMRLLYYFPKETAELIGTRIDKLDVAKGDFRHRGLANGLQSDEFIKSVNWCREAAVRQALVRLFERAEDAGSLLAAVPAVEDRTLIRKRLEPLAANLSGDDNGPYGDGYELLMVLGQRTPETAKPIFQGYLKSASADRCHTMCVVLRRIEVDFDTELLTPLLTDKRDWGWKYDADIGDVSPRLEIRVCDEAAITLSHNHPEFKFVRRGTHADLDRQIAVIREQIAHKK